LCGEDADNVAVFAVKVEVDVVTAPALEKELDSIAPGTNLVIDLCETTFMDSAGCGFCSPPQAASMDAFTLRASPAVLSGG
jgi:hypothetical protein